MSSEKVSIIVPLYNEQDNVSILAEEIYVVVQQIANPCEVILVNDGSTDNTWASIEEICARYPVFSGIDLGGNFGQSIALRSGFENSSGEIIIFMDGDMQHNPADIPRFIEKIDEGYDMVGGSKQERPEGFIQSKLSNMAHWLIYKITKAKMDYFGATFRIYRRFLLENTNILKDTHRFLGAVLAKKGIRQTEIPITIRERHAGKSSYKITKLFSVIIDLIFLKFVVTYMNKPFRLFGVFGLIIFVLGMVPLIYIVGGALFFDFNVRIDYISEFVLSIFFILIGIFMISFGIVAEIGIYNYFSGDHIRPYSIRKKTKHEK
ncbi:glycosyltransferase family 2 protein [Algoriphagus chordae]|uniref:Glycosyltransferase involved in cell wall biosynthesis n=1 Tax=Algoriphagus chordae TaxID=237019 RepID=A0A2W7R8H1_9BACT|nr:glycosyltransferase family 2 protein [Algoriphagus chordae]PZX56714.1 glycosyltransferase involved in cell wall biosynthesis [Algoriphagus chordae]